MQLQFDFGASTYPGETVSASHEGFTFTATIYADDDATPPWKRADGHGTVSDWESRAKAPGEVILADDHGSKRFYDMAEAVKIARRDGWGVSPYRMDTEHGANGLLRQTGQWFEGREVVTFASDWTDDINDATRQVYAAHRATMSAGAYAALAARSDFEFLRQWCADEWSYVGVAVVVSRDGVDLTDEYDFALWGIESEAGAYIGQVAADLAREALPAARAKLAEIALEAILSPDERLALNGALHVAGERYRADALECATLAAFQGDQMAATLAPLFTQQAANVSGLLAKFGA